MYGLAVVVAVVAMVEKGGEVVVVAVVVGAAAADENTAVAGAAMVNTLVVVVEAVGGVSNVVSFAGQHHCVAWHALVVVQRDFAVERHPSLAGHTWQSTSSYQSTV